MELGACSVCGEPAKSKGMCRKHYLVAWRAAHPNYDKTIKAEYWKKNKARRKAIQDRYYERNKAAILERQRKCWATESPIVELEALLGEVESNSIDVREAPR